MNELEYMPISARKAPTWQWKKTTPNPTTESSTVTSSIITTSIWGGRKNPGLVGMDVSSSTGGPIVTTSNWNGRKVPWADGPWTDGVANLLKLSPEQWLERFELKGKTSPPITEDPTSSIPENPYLKKYISTKGKGSKSNPRGPNRNADSFWDEMFKEWNDRKDGMMDSTPGDSTPGPITTGWSDRKNSGWIKGNPGWDKDDEKMMRMFKDWSGRKDGMMMESTPGDPTPGPVTTGWSGRKNSGWNPGWNPGWDKDDEKMMRKFKEWNGRKDGMMDSTPGDSTPGDPTPGPVTTGWSGRKGGTWKSASKEDSIFENLPAELKGDKDSKWDWSSKDFIERSKDSKPKMSLEDYMKSLLVNKKK